MTDQLPPDTPTATATDSPPPPSAAAAPAAPSSPAPQAELIPAEDPEDTSDIDRYEIDSALGSDADFADAYPSAQVIGSDLSPTQPEWVPANVHFEIADATLTWPWKDNYFDFTHIRYLFGSVQDWPALFQEAYRCCAPGGWVQSCEADIHFYSDDGTTDSEPALQKWADLYEKGGAATGRTFFLQQEALQERSITEAGFTDVRIFDYKLPVGGWTSNRKLFELGEYVRLTLENDLEGYTLYIWHNVLNWPREEYPQFLAAMRKAICSRKVHGYMMVRIFLTIASSSSVTTATHVNITAELLPHLQGKPQQATKKRREKTRLSDVHQHPPRPRARRQDRNQGRDHQIQPSLYSHPPEQARPPSLRTDREDQRYSL
ncbi:methyltransferase [Fusarium tjaetaba]|uniref:Methyltransferase n=1 Tax=Fusarium tjaetaba TaxID=1567544 RepID=A0A8H5QKF3_9HYPO|nr:methyltransferase [Fusarium tjaetaba]KAF5616138.1 methyltransferase [Fusarium tjaetaba]